MEIYNKQFFVFVAAFLFIIKTFNKDGNILLIQLCTHESPKSVTNVVTSGVSFASEIGAFYAFI
jgi:hypothetical protein